MPKRNRTTPKRIRIEPRAYIGEVKKMPLCAVIWDDANVDDFDGPADEAHGDSVRNHTAGWLLKVTTNNVIVVTDATPEDNTVRWVYTIPKKMIFRLLTTNLKAGDIEWQSSTNGVHSVLEAEPAPSL